MKVAVFSKGGKVERKKREKCKKYSCMCRSSIVCELRIISFFLHHIIIFDIIIIIIPRPTPPLLAEKKQTIIIV
jgi:hypothetical protein